MTPRTRRRWLSTLRIVICVLALWFVVRGVSVHDRFFPLADAPPIVGTVDVQADSVQIQRSDGSIQRWELDRVAKDEQGSPRIEYGLKTAWRNSSKGLLAVALLVCFPVAFLLGVRLQWLLRAQAIELGYWDCVKLSFAGNFLNFAAPLGSNAGDVFKAYFVSLHTSRKTEAMTTIALDRLLGLGTLIAVVSLITLLSPIDSRLAEFRWYVCGFLAAGMVLLGAYVTPQVRRVLLPRKFLERLPIATQLQRIDRAALDLLRNKATLASAIAVTILLQIFALGSYFITAKALALNAHAGNVLEYFAYFYLGAVIQSLPGPPQGLGTVELAYRYFLAPFGSVSQILCVAFAIRVIVLLCALPGAIVTMTGSYRPKYASAPLETDEGQTPKPNDYRD